MTVKEFLKRGRLLNREILELTEARTRAFNAACGGAVDTSAERVQTTPANGSEGKFLTYAAYGTEIEERIRELNGYRQRMLESISKVESTTYRSLLIAYYINCKTWEQVAEDMNYSLRTIHRLHGKALWAIDCKVGTKCH